MITKDQLQQMSDFDVNLSLAKLVCKTHITYTRGAGEMVCVDNVKVEYCNNPSDIMPLQIEHKINILWHADEQQWMAMNFFGKFFDANLLRAIACCLILVLQEQRK